MQYEWILDVLTDLKAFAKGNGLTALAEQLDDTSLVAAAEIAQTAEDYGRRNGSGCRRGWQASSRRYSGRQRLTISSPSSSDCATISSVEHLVYHSVNSTGQQYAVLTYSPAWVDRYIDEDFARIDPVVQGCFRRFHPVDWKNLDWSGRNTRAFLGEALDAGVGNQGYSVPIRGPNGQFAMFTVSNRAHDDTWQKFTGRTCLRPDPDRAFHQPEGAGDRTRHGFPRDAEPFARARSTC